MYLASQAPSIDRDDLPWLQQLTDINPWYGFGAFVLTVLLTVIVFNLGFARKLPLLKTLIIYALLVMGSFGLWFMEFVFGAPTLAVLVISGLVLGAYRFRLHVHRKEKANESNT
ncbi:YlaH-like family protein [Shouchella shacheensis]|uniref:YlaH-like family protein n=1 Tax=Shouchella shacheensis TaxID=1649580 RepID=UPI00073FC92D|nr:YlaH-like family protein [Shouchella shacheensis]